MLTAESMRVLEPYGHRAVRLAAKLTNAPLAWIELLDNEGSVILARQGMPHESERSGIDLSQVPSTVPVVVGAPPISESASPLASWMVAPLRARDGVLLGGLVVADTQPRAWSADEQANLGDLATMLSRHVEAEQLQAQHALVAQQYRAFEDLISIGPMVVLRWERDLDWRITYASRNIQAHFGYNPDDITSGRLSYRSLIHPDDVDHVTQALQDCLHKGINHFHQRYRLRHADGSYRYVAEHTLLVRDDAGQLRHYLGYIYDVTERQEAENALYQQTVWLKSIIDSDTAYIARTDMEARFTFVNRHFVDLIRRAYQRDLALVGADSLETIVPEDRDLTIETVKTCLSIPGHPVQVVLRKPNPAGGYFHTLWEFVAVVNAQGQPSEVQCVGFDITPLMRTQEDLRRANALLQSIVDGEAAYLIRTDLHARFTFVNERFRRLIRLAYPELGDDLIGLNSMETIIPEDHERTLAAVQQCIAAPGKPYQVVLRKHRPAGGHFFTLWEFTGVPDANGSVVEIQCIGFDITELVQTQQILSEREERYRFIFENTLDAIALHAPDGRILYTNADHVQLLDYTSQELTAMNVEELTRLVHPEDLPRLQAEQAQHMAEGRVVAVYVYRMLKKDGTPFWIENRVRYLYDIDGVLRGIITISRDINERVQAQEALRRSEERYRTLTRMMSDFVFEGGFVEDGALIVRWLEGDYEAVTGYPMETAVETWQNAIVEHPEDLPTIEADLRRTLAGEYTSTEFRIQHLRGHYVWVRVTRLPIIDPATGRVTGYYGVVQDIDAEKTKAALQAEQERLSANLRREEALNQTIRRVVSAVSHDIRTPLAVISTSKELLSRYYERLTEERRIAAFETIDKQLSYMTKMLDDLGRIVKGTLIERQLQLSSVNIETLCRVIVRELQQSIGHKHVLRFEADWQQDLVMIDETLVNRILFNLLSNAIKFSPEGSTITLRLAQEGRHVVLQVQDEGIGIPLDAQEKIFDLFYRAENARAIDGTGLGLSIVKECVERHAGTIQLRSELGQGSIFTVELPLLVEQQPMWPTTYGEG